MIKIQYFLRPCRLFKKKKKIFKKFLLVIFSRHLCYLAVNTTVKSLNVCRHMVTLPSAPGLPSHKSNRPYSVYELEQMRQHCRRWDRSHPQSFSSACPEGGLKTQTYFTVFCRFHTVNLTWTSVICTATSCILGNGIVKMTESIWTYLKMYEEFV